MKNIDNSMKRIEKLASYDEAVSYILEIPRFLAKNDADATKEFLGILGEGNAEITIHVAGTNGKGSTCAFLNSVFMAMDKKVGMFTSPHLVDIRERIQINGKLIGKEEFLNCTNIVIDNINRFQDKKAGFHPSFFEFIFFVAVIHFKMNDIDVAIYETGLGGRLDATNSLSKKSVSVITEIGMDHMEYLGDTYEKIAFEKAGIIKPNVPVVFWDGRKECSLVIREKAWELGCKAFEVCEQNVEVLCTKEKNIDFSYKSLYDKNVIFTVHSYAQYQVRNAAMAVKTLEVLGFDIEASAVNEGIAEMFWPGRMEMIDDQIFVDGGHNVDGIEAFIHTALNDECKGSRHLLFSAVSDKQIGIIAKMLVECDAFHKISVCGFDSYRATKVEELKAIFDKVIADNGSNMVVGLYDDVQGAFEKEKELLGADDRLYICGSLYLVGAVKEYVEARK